MAPSALGIRAAGCSYRGLDHSAADQHHDEPGPDTSGRHRTEHQIEHPAGSGRAVRTGSLPTSREESERSRQCHDRNSGPGPGRRPSNPQRGMRCQEQDRQREDDDEAGDDEGKATDEGSAGSSQSPGAQNCELGRRRTRQEVRGGDPVFKLLMVQPASLVDAERPQHGDMCRLTPEPETADPTPLTGDSGEGNRTGQICPLLCRHRSRRRPPAPITRSVRSARRRTPDTRGPVCGALRHRGRCLRTNTASRLRLRHRDGCPRTPASGLRPQS